MSNYSILNNVAATSGDYGAGAGYVYLTGLNPFLKTAYQSRLTVTPSKYKNAGGTLAFGFYQLDAAAVLGTSSTVLTWSGGGTPQTYLGEVLECVDTVTGLVYYAAVPTTDTTSVTVTTWLGVNGTPPDGNSFVVTRKGDTFTSVTFAAVSAAQTANTNVTFTGAYGSQEQTLNYSIPLGNAATNTGNALAFYNLTNDALASNGFYSNYVSNVVYIRYPANTSLVIASASGGTNLAPTVTNTIAAPTNRIGYGADLIALGFPTASSATANDGFVSTSFYYEVDITIAGTSFGGVVQPSQTYKFFCNNTTETANSATLIGTIETNLP